MFGHMMSHIALILPPLVATGRAVQDYSGTNYITTGAGMALSNRALQRLMSCTSCSCRAPDAPDDMSLGTWFRSLGIETNLGRNDVVSRARFVASQDAPCEVRGFIHWDPEGGLV